jgi:hypothetical protein
MEYIDHYKQLINDRKDNPYLASSIEVYITLFQEKIKQNQLLLVSFTSILEYLNTQLKQSNIYPEHKQHIKQQIKQINKDISDVKGEITMLEKIL